MPLSSLPSQQLLCQSLVEHGADLRHMPDKEATKRTPFVRPPPQSALGEAARCGFVEICKLLLDKGADKDQRNHLWWTPLHEAAFYNHEEAVKTLLVYGADAAITNRQGAFPFQLASLPSVREVIHDLGGEGAAPDFGRSTFAFGGSATMGIEPRNPFLIDFSSYSSPDSLAPSAAESSPFSAEAATKSRPFSKLSSFHDRRQPQPQSKETTSNGTMLHSGSMLGDLPSLDSHKKSVHSLSPSGGGPESEEFMRPSVKSSSTKGRSGGAKPEVPPGFPCDLLCSISQRPLKDAVRSPHGHLFERRIIERWIRDNGSVCPLTGHPLGAAELSDAPNVRTAVDDWYAQRARRIIDEQSAVNGAVGPCSTSSGVGAAQARAQPAGSCAAADEALYGF